VRTASCDRTEDPSHVQIEFSHSPGATRFRADDIPRSHGSMPFRAASAMRTLAGIRAGGDGAVRLRQRTLRVRDPNHANGISRPARVRKRSRDLMVARAHVQGPSRDLTIARAHMQGPSRDLTIARAHVQGPSRDLLADLTHALVPLSRSLVPACAHAGPVLTIARPGWCACRSHCHDRRACRTRAQIPVSHERMTGRMPGTTGPPAGEPVPRDPRAHSRRSTVARNRDPAVMIPLDCRLPPIYNRGGRDP
jgi:hypothetical protein